MEHKTNKMRKFQTAGVIPKPSILYRAPQTAAQDALMRAKNIAHNKANKDPNLDDYSSPEELPKKIPAIQLVPAQVARINAKQRSTNISLPTAAPQYVAAPSTNPDVTRRLIEDAANKKIIANVEQGTATDYEKNLYKFKLDSGKIYAKDDIANVNKNKPVSKPQAVASAEKQKKKVPSKVTTASKSKAVSVDERIKRIQRSLGVEVDGMWGKETQTAYLAMKKTQEGLGLPQDGIRGKATTQGIYDRDMVAVNSAKDMKVPATFDKSAGEEIVIAQPSKTPREMRREARVTRRKINFLDKINNEEYAAMRRGGLLYKK